MVDELKIFIFRHGQSEYNRDKRFTGWQDAKLTPLGIEQAKKIAEMLRDKVFQVAYHTRLQRSKDTLKEVLRYHPNVEIIEDDRMIERSYGLLEGRSHQSVIEEVGKEQFDIWHRSYDVPPPSGESIKMVEKRVLEFIEDLLTKMKQDKVNVAISAHGNSMRPFIRYFEGLSIEEMMALEVPWDKYYEFSVTDG
ncbi:MAG: 2,3-bisphosphoglycerate-dependent phosphoglycerate mutase [Candidatus Helarchaeota archaeon]